MTVFAEYRLPEGRTTLLAHDVRHMRACSVCAKPGDQRMMVTADDTRGMNVHPDAKWHPKCFLNHFGRQAVLSLKRSGKMQFALNDTGPDLMRELLE